MRRPRNLSAEERALWDSVAKQAKPLRKTPRRKSPTIALHSAKHLSPELPPTPDPLSASSRRGPPHERGVVGSSAPAAIAKASPTRPSLERREKARLARGHRDIDARLDLHGMTQARAHHALLGFLQRAQADGCRYVLVITGKGKVSAEGTERGVLRRQVPEWFALTEFRVLVTGYEEAAIGHGGAGALYVRVRRG